jgi:hypothetical protein
MAEVIYRVVEHDGGWAYKVGDVFSETFRTHDDALAAAKIAAAEQRAAGQDVPIEYQTEDGRWHTETARGTERPETEVEDDAKG